MATTLSAADLAKLSPEQRAEHLDYHSPVNEAAREAAYWAHQAAVAARPRESWEEIRAAGNRLGLYSDEQIEDSFTDLKDHLK